MRYVLIALALCLVLQSCQSAGGGYPDYGGVYGVNRGGGGGRDNR